MAELAEAYCDWAASNPGRAWFVFWGVLAVLIVLAKLWKLGDPPDEL